jgi:hypothetical protein
MYKNIWISALGGLGFTILSLFLFAPLSWAQDFCGQGDMQAVLDTIPPCSNDSIHEYGEHFGDVMISLLDCTTGDTLGTIQLAVHELPPCPQPPAGIGTFPPAGVDTIIGTTGNIIFSLITPPVMETLIVGGDMRILRSDPDPVTRQIDTEILSMQLTGSSPSIGPISVKAGSDFGLPPSLGTINPIGNDYPAFSSFAVNFEITPLTGVEEKKEGTRAKSYIVLHETTPNPLTTQATIRFGLIESGWVSLKVYNLRGERVRTLIDDYRTAGLHKGVWDLKDEVGRDVSSGVYFYRLTALSGSATQKMILIR